MKALLNEFTPSNTLAWSILEWIAAPESGRILNSMGSCPLLSSGVVFIMNTVPPQGNGADCMIFEGKAPIPYGNRTHDEYSPGLNCLDLPGHKLVWLQFPQIMLCANRRLCIEELICLDRKDNAAESFNLVATRSGVRTSWSQKQCRIAGEQSHHSCSQLLFTMLYLKLESDFSSRPGVSK